MEDYNQQLSENTNSRVNFVYGGSIVAPSSSVYGRTTNSGFHLQQTAGYDQPTVKTEDHASTFHYPSVSRGFPQDHYNHHHRRPENDNSGDVDAIKAKITAHPQYSNLLDAYMDCQKAILSIPIQSLPLLFLYFNLNQNRFFDC